MISTYFYPNLMEQTFDTGYMYPTENFICFAISVVCRVIFDLKKSNEVTSYKVKSKIEENQCYF